MLYRVLITADIWYHMEKIHQISGWSAETLLVQAGCEHVALTTMI